MMVSLKLVKKLGMNKLGVRAVLLAGSLGLGAATMPVAHAADYTIDAGHTFVHFRIQHLGYSWLYGRFNKFSGSFSYDAANPITNSINMTIDTASVDTNHAKRDKHLRGSDFLDVEKFPTARFISSGYKGTAEGGMMSGTLTLNGVTKPIKIAIKKLGEGKDPWGGYRSGFIGTTKLKRADFGISYNLGPASETMESELGIEGTHT